MTTALDYRTGWKCLDGGMLTIEDESFPTLEAARARARQTQFARGLGRRVFLMNGAAGFKIWRVRLGPDYLPHGHRTGWGMW
jgi:hypothetical protein